MKNWQQIMIAFFLGVAASGLFVLVITPSKKEPIKLLPPPTFIPSTTPAETENATIQPVTDEKTPPAPVNSPIFPINVNTASETELLQLPGIGETRAADIVEYRQLHGPFTSLDDLDQVHGIGPATLEQLRDLVKFTD